jgi:hypothetical protein
MVRLDGEAAAVKAGVVTVGVNVGDRVWCQFYGRQLAVVGSPDSGDRQVFTEHARQMFYGGGLRQCTTTTLSWSKRFMVTDMGRSARTATGGYFNIDQPPDGTVIPVYGKPGTTSVTVASGAVPLAAWESLWYTLPFGQSPLMVPANFFITHYSGDNYVPPNAVCIGIRNGDETGIRWGDGLQSQPWTYPTLSNSWTNYGSGFPSARYKRENGTVYVEGLVKTGTVGSGGLWTMPVGYRPDGTILRVGASSGGLAGLRLFSSGVFAIYELYSGTTASVSLGFSYTPDQ